MSWELERSGRCTKSRSKGRKGRESGDIEGVGGKGKSGKREQGGRVSREVEKENSKGARKVEGAGI